MIWHDQKQPNKAQPKISSCCDEITLRDEIMLRGEITGLNGSPLIQLCRSMLRLTLHELLVKITTLTYTLG